MRLTAIGTLTVAAVLALLPGNARASAASELQEAVNDYEAARYPQAALKFFDVAENGGEAEYGFRAEYFLALTLYKMGMLQSALTYDNVIIGQGHNHPYYLKAIENTLDVMDAVGDKSLIPNMLDKEYDDQTWGKLPKAVIDRINFIVALWSYKQRKFEDSSSFLEAVPPESAVYARAKYLQGLDLARKAQEKGAQDPMKTNEAAAKIFTTVVNLQNTDKVTYTGLDDLKELAQLALARVRYAQAGYLYGRGEDTKGLFGKAYDEYHRIPRFSRHWRDALFEGAYAAFMNEEPGKALGDLQTLHAPVAGDQLVAESWLLRAHVYYTLCLFDESKAALQKMADTYSPIKDQLDALLEAKREPEFYYNLLQKGSDGGTAMPAMVRNELLVDETLRGRRGYILELQQETEKLKNVDEWKKSDLVQVLLDAVDQQRAQMVQVVGKTVVVQLKAIKGQLEDLDGQADIVRFEMAKREKDLLEANYDAESVLKKQPLYRPAMPPKGIEYWDFEGEFWPDELGFYRYTIKNACPEDEQANK